MVKKLIRNIDNLFYKNDYPNAKHVKVVFAYTDNSTIQSVSDFESIIFAYKHIGSTVEKLAVKTNLLGKNVDSLIETLRKYAILMMLRLLIVS